MYQSRIIPNRVCFAFLFILLVSFPWPLPKTLRSGTAFSPCGSLSLPTLACAPLGPTDLVFHLFRISVGEGKSSLDWTTLYWDSKKRPEEIVWSVINAHAFQLWPSESSALSGQCNNSVTPHPRPHCFSCMKKAHRVLLTSPLFCSSELCDH